MLTWELRRLSPIAFDAFMFVLTVLKFWQSRREGLSRPTLNTMVRDGTWAFTLSLGERQWYTSEVPGRMRTHGNTFILILNLVVYNVFLKTLSGVVYL